MKNTFLLALVLFTITVQAQKKVDSLKTTVDSNYRIMLFLGIQYNYQSFTNLNNRLSSFGALYNELPKSIISSSFGWASERNNLLFKSNLSVGRGMKGNPEKRSSTLNLFSGTFEWGYNLSKSKHTKFYPMVGVGVSSFSATLNRDLSNLNFNDILQNPNIQTNTTSIKITNSFFNYKVGVEIDIYDKKYRNYAVGLFASYTGSFKNRSWKVNMEQQVANAPVDGLSQFNAGINFMMQYKRKRKTV